MKNDPRMPEKLEALARPVLEGLGYDLVDLEWRPEGGTWVLRLFIDVDGPDPEGHGVSHDDCSRASRSISAELDVADLIHHHFTLEVSSPGLNRPLKRERDFQRFAGQKAKIRTRHAIGAPPGRKNFAGRLGGVEAGRVRIDVDGQLFDLPIDDIEKAHLQYNFDAAPRPQRDGGATDTQETSKP
jgi:ribosome maturation factor RimP